MRAQTTKVFLTAVALVMTAGGTAQAHDRPRECGAWMLKGLYVFSATGFNIVQGVAQPKAVTEFIRLNGDGTLTVPAATVSQNGAILRLPPNGIGTYTVEPDCTGKLQFGPPGASFDLFVAPSGWEIYMNQTGGAVPGVLEGRAKRIGR